MNGCDKLTIIGEIYCHLTLHHTEVRGHAHTLSYCYG